MRDNIKPSIILGENTLGLNTGTITYNQYGIAYSNSSYTYGGFYGSPDSLKPSLIRLYSLIPSIIKFSDISSGTTTPPTPTPTPDTSGYAMGLLLALTYPS